MSLLIIDVLAAGLVLAAVVVALLAVLERIETRKGDNP